MTSGLYFIPSATFLVTLVGLTINTIRLTISFNKVDKQGIDLWLVFVKEAKMFANLY